MSTPSVKLQGPGRPKDMEKRAAILDAAMALFVRNAFAGTSMDAVAAEAGVSKLTVYSHFGDKDNLFREVIRTRLQDLLPEDIYRYRAQEDIRDTLERVALYHVRLDCNAQHVGILRVVLGDCRQGNPRYGKLLWEEGPCRTRSLMQGLLQQAVDDGKLDIPDVTRAAVQFLSLIKGEMLLRRMFGCEECATSYAAELEQTARDGVAMFLRAYRKR